LFSAAVAALVAVSIQDLRPNSQDTSAFYLEKIFQLLADPHVSRASILATSTKPPPFSPPKYAIWVNSLWLLSLVMSLTCALLATLLQQWARRYVTITQPPRYSPHKRARIRAFFADGIDKLHLPWAVEALPALLHVSLFLFLFGLLVFLFNINHTVFNVVVWWVGLSTGVYGFITLMPIFRHDSPYYAPLSLSVWFIYTRASYEVFRILRFITHSFNFHFDTWVAFEVLSVTYGKRLSEGMLKAAQESASKLSAKIDGRALEWTFEALDEDQELLQFFEGIPGFCSSKVVNEPRRILAELDKWRLSTAFGGFLKRTFSSSFLSDTVKERRVMVCMRAVDAIDHPFPSGDFLRDVFKPDMYGALQSIQMGHSLRSRCHSSDRETALYAQAIVAGIITRVPERDHRWKALVMDQLGIPEDVLREYLAHGDSVLLANWIDINRRFHRFGHVHRYMPYQLLMFQATIPKFDIQNTLPVLQHDFCALWNEISDWWWLAQFILRRVRHSYIALHQGTDCAPTAFDASTADHDIVLSYRSSYPLCTIPAHQSRINNATATAENSHPPTVPPPTVLLPHTI
jgi:Family of unknown function (DUF6535)